MNNNLPKSYLEDNNLLLAEVPTQNNNNNKPIKKLIHPVQKKKINIPLVESFDNSTDSYFYYTD